MAYDMAEAVRNGAAWLTEKDKNWVLNINPFELIMSDGACCVLGQNSDTLNGGVADTLNGGVAGYHGVLERFNKTSAWAEQHGFNVPYDVYSDCDDDAEINAAYNKLRKLWLTAMSKAYRDIISEARRH